MLGCCCCCCFGMGLLLFGGWLNYTLLAKFAYRVRAFHGKQDAHDEV